VTYHCAPSRPCQGSARSRGSFNARGGRHTLSPDQMPARPRATGEVTEPPSCASDEPGPASFGRAPSPFEERMPRDNHHPRAKGKADMDACAPRWPLDELVLRAPRHGARRYVRILHPSVRSTPLHASDPWIHRGGRKSGIEQELVVRAEALFTSSFPRVVFLFCHGSLRP
jgi:hypothetical protein